MDALGIAQRLKLNRSDGQPLYLQIHKGLRKLILEETLGYGQVLPAEKDLAQTLGVSHMTLRQALDRLEGMGLVERRHGMGTIVRRPRFQHDVTRLASFSEDMHRRGLVPSAQILGKEVIQATPEVAHQLRLKAGEAVICLERLRLADGIAIALHTAFLPASRVKLEDLGEGSLYESLERKGILLTTAEEFIEATEANESQAGLLKLSAGKPLLLLTRVSYDQKNLPVELVYARYRSDVYRYFVHLSRSGGEE